PDAARRRGARRRTDRALGGLRRQSHVGRARRRRQARRVPVAGRTTGGRVSRAFGVAGLVRGVRGIDGQHRSEADVMTHYDLAIIGTGSGNSVLDERYRDMSVAICEQGVFGGTCLNVGCIPTKMFVYAAEVAQSARESAQYGVDAHVDGVRWVQFVSRIFARIDPLAMGGENYRRSSPNVAVFASHTRFGSPLPD